MGIFGIASESHFEVRRFCTRNRAQKLLNSKWDSEVIKNITIKQIVLKPPKTIILWLPNKKLLKKVHKHVIWEAWILPSFPLFLIQKLRTSKWDSEAIRKMPILQIGLNTHQTLLFWPPIKKLPKKVGGHMIWEAWILPIFA